MKTLVIWHDCVVLDSRNLVIKTRLLLVLLVIINNAHNFFKRKKYFLKFVKLCCFFNDCVSTRWKNIFTLKNLHALRNPSHLRSWSWLCTLGSFSCSWTASSTPTLTRVNFAKDVDWVNGVILARFTRNALSKKTERKDCNAGFPHH